MNATYYYYHQYYFLENYLLGLRACFLVCTVGERCLPQRILVKIKLENYFEMTI